jgi:hypothetical protein
LRVYKLKNHSLRQTKTRLYINRYNRRVSYPSGLIYLALVGITAWFCFPEIATDIIGSLGFTAEKLFFLSTSHVFGSNTSVSSWEPLRRAIQNMIPIYSKWDN